MGWDGVDFHSLQAGPVIKLDWRDVLGVIPAQLPFEWGPPYSPNGALFLHTYF